MQVNSNAGVMFISHGGGPLPLLGDPGHQEMVKVIKDMRRLRGTPDAVVVISAHWESNEIAVTSSKSPGLLYDYYGFSDEAYKIKYPCAGAPELASFIVSELNKNDISAREDNQRGLDHGVFVPMKLLFPEANIPCVQVSLSATLSVEQHIELGHALRGLRDKNVLIIGSGFTFHNMREFYQPSTDRNLKSESFLDWLLTVSEDKSLTQGQREEHLISWEKQASARFNHPREEHLLPYFVCVGLAGNSTSDIWRHNIFGVPCANVLWK